MKRSIRKKTRSRRKNCTSRRRSRRNNRISRRRTRRNNRISRRKRKSRRRSRRTSIRRRSRRRSMKGGEMSRLQKIGMGATAGGLVGAAGTAAKMAVGGDKVSLATTLGGAAVGAAAAAVGAGIGELIARSPEYTEYKGERENKEDTEDTEDTQYKQYTDEEIIQKYDNHIHKILEELEDLESIQRESVIEYPILYHDIIIPWISAARDTEEENKRKLVAWEFIQSVDSNAEHANEESQFKLNDIPPWLGNAIYLHLNKIDYNLYLDFTFKVAERVEQRSLAEEAPAAEKAEQTNEPKTTIHNNPLVVDNNDLVEF